ncbi:ER degradation-enhancing alpha-mannosidase 3 isoform X2 [Brachionus plicatilis]|uniref:alpha-1,2-Mannosidase n=1 Tax=Brachionus plicatilis TaxID=10195 RepID=A0A3M7P6S9_BRAPC|nr:ER degradation-enhancing alpha-mannosidase 3 isoform X2 [Brachionus plicatilis]
MLNKKIFSCSNSRSLPQILTFYFLIITLFSVNSNALTKSEKNVLKGKVLQMFDHAFNSYMKYAYPADELMPLSCKGRYRIKEAPRGDIDEVLGNFTLTLVDSLDTLALLGKVDQFEQAVRDVIKNTHFDRDIVVSVFESNIRMLGGLLSGHISLIYLKHRHFPNRFNWYRNELLSLAKDLGFRLLHAFNTTTGLPRSRVNLKYGITKELKTGEKNTATCTACAGTLLLEFVLLSRLSGEKVFEDKVMKTMDYLWHKRNRVSDLVGTVINIHDGEWLNKDSSIGAGIDSYYEYLFKGYILLGDENLLYRFNKHYDSITKYMSVNLNGNNILDAEEGSSLKTVHMHMPNRQARNYIDALLAFWPGLQVLKGDIKGAIKFHEVLHQIVKKHDFLPEAVLFDHSIHWSNHPLRPEFLESTYYLYRATKDDFYLEIGKKMIEQLEKFSRVPCGYAAIADLKTKQKEDRMDSFVYAETFKYLYLMFADEDELLFDIDDFIFTTEAHLVPLDLDDYASKKFKNTSTKDNKADFNFYSNNWKDKTCPSLKFLFNSQDVFDATKRIRNSVGKMNEKKCEKTTQFVQKSINLDKLRQLPLRAQDFVAGRNDHMNILKKMGISLSSMPDGRVQLIHKTNEAFNYDDAEMGILFMTDMLEYSKKSDFKLKTSDADEYRSLSVILLSKPFNGSKVYQAGPAQFGLKLRSNLGYFGKLVLSEPIDACSSLKGNASYFDKIIVAKRGNCMFVEKARIVEKFGAIGLIIIDNSEETSYSTSTFFAMSGDGFQNVTIPSVFLFGKEGNDLLWNLRSSTGLVAFIGDNFMSKNLSGLEKSLIINNEQLKFVLNVARSRDCFLKEKFEIVFKTSSKYFQCLVDDYEILKDFFEIFNEKKKNLKQIDKNDEAIEVSQMLDEDSKVVHRFKLDETIEIRFRDDGNEKKLVLDLNPIIQMPEKMAKKNEQSDNDYAMSIFATLIKRFEQKTNFLKLEKTDRFNKILFKYVASKLNPTEHQFTKDDQKLFDELAKNLDLF